MDVSSITLSRKYVAFKVSGCKFWYWFPVSSIKCDGDVVIGRGGWGLDGAFTNLQVHESEIVGLIESDELQYESE